jgi:hypothetical protein
LAPVRHWSSSEFEPATDPRPSASDPATVGADNTLHEDGLMPGTYGPFRVLFSPARSETRSLSNDRRGATSITRICRRRVGRRGNFSESPSWTFIDKTHDPVSERFSNLPSGDATGSHRLSSRPSQ